MGTTLVLLKSLFVPFASPGRSSLPGIKTLIELCLLYNCSISIQIRDFFWSLSMLMTYQSLGIVTCPEISKSNTIWQEIDKINKKESP